MTMYRAINRQTGASPVRWHTGEAQPFTATAPGYEIEAYDVELQSWRPRPPLDPEPLVGPLGARYPLWEDWWLPAYADRAFSPRADYSQNKEDYA